MGIDGAPSVSGAATEPGAAASPHEDAVQPVASGPAATETTEAELHMAAASRLNIANQLTILRLLLIPVIALSLSLPFANHDLIGAILYWVAATTDTLDGFIARRRKLVTTLGKFLDPLVDKILVVTVLAILVSESALPTWVIVVVFTREFLITGLRFVAAQQGVVVGSTPWGKSKTLTQNAMIIGAILERPYPVLAAPAGALLWLAVVATVTSGVDYLWRYRRYVL